MEVSIQAPNSLWKDEEDYISLSMGVSGETNFWAAGIKDWGRRGRTRRGVKAEHSECGPWWWREKQTQRSELTTPRQTRNVDSSLGLSQAWERSPWQGWLVSDLKMLLKQHHQRCPKTTTSYPGWGIAPIFLRSWFTKCKLIIRAGSLSVFLARKHRVIPSVSSIKRSNRKLKQNSLKLAPLCHPSSSTRGCGW